MSDVRTASHDQLHKIIRDQSIAHAVRSYAAARLVKEGSNGIDLDTVEGALILEASSVYGIKSFPGSAVVDWILLNLCGSAAGGNNLDQLEDEIAGLLLNRLKKSISEDKSNDNSLDGDVSEYNTFVHAMRTRAEALGFRKPRQ
jgi:hypothetical protein